MPIGPDDASYVLDLAQQERYADAYRYMAAQIRIDPSWDASLADWADRAADINGSEPNFWKDWVFTFNANAAGKEPTNPETIAWNQEISDELARKALNDFIEAADNGLVLSPAQLYQRDVVEAVDQAGNPTWAWAGGPLGKLFGFPMGDTYDSVDDYQSWIVNALKTIGNLPDWYVSYAADFVVDTIADYWDFAKDIGANFDTSKWLDELGDLLRHFRSDPLVLDLDGDGVTLTALAASNTRFDIDGDGAVERVGWVGPNDGLLVLDANQNGQVDGIDELIGNTHVDGFDELTTLDSNADGKIDQLDADFSKLLVWRDVNGDGVSSSSELLTTAQAGILNFKLAYTASGAETGGNLIARLGSYTLASGTQRAMASVQFAKDETVTRPTLPANADLGDIATLPNLGGYGPMADLRTSMYHDQTLKDMVLDLVTEDHDFDTFKDFLDGGFMDILYRWAGIDLHAAGETSASLKEKLIEALTGESLFALSAGQQARIDDVFNSIIGKFGVGFLVQAADRPANLLMVGLGDQLASLDPNDASYLDDVAGLTETALSNIAAVQLPYDYLEKFTSLSLDPTTGAVVGDFDAFAREFIEDQPSFFFITSNFGPPPVPPKTDGMMVSTFVSDEEAPEPEPVHPWLAWYEKEGSLLFNVAASMGIGADYVKNVTGWQWLMNPAAEVQGTSGNDVLNVVVSTITERISSFSADGGTVYSNQSRQTRNQRLYGYEGNDELRGNDGVDTLVGGAGNDQLFGGSDSDMYVYSAASGLDRITEESGADDAVFFSSELKLNDLQVIRITDTDDLQLHFGDSSQGIILTNQVNMGGSGVERFSFVGVGPLSAGDIATIYLRSLATQLNDIITGTAAGEAIRGLNGDDLLSGLNGDDTIFGDEGNDVIRGGDGNDRLEGGVGDDVIAGDSSNDILIGGAGNDLLSGNYGDETYVFNVGDGQDVISDDGNGTDTVQLGAGITASDVTVIQADNGDDLVLLFVGSDDRIILNDTIDSTARRIEQVTFADGTVWTHADLLARSITSNGGDNVFYGGYDAESILGGAGDDTLNGRSGNDVLIGGSGNDLLTGNYGDDTYVFNMGDGQDMISDDGSGSDTIQLGVGVVPTDVNVIQADNGTDLVLLFAGSDDRIILNDTVDNAGRRIERVIFANGTVWTHADLLARSILNSSGDNVFYGSYDAENIAGGAGDDALFGRAGNDVLVGGAGNDQLSGNGGDDTYVFNMGDGQDTITDDGDGTDTVQLGVGIAPADVTVIQADNGNDLVLLFAGNSDRITLNDTANNGWRRIERVTFADGTVWTHADLLARVSTVDLVDVQITGTSASETLTGGAGNDVLNGYVGNDILIGGTGNDFLTGGGGDDTFRFGLGDGKDIVRDAWGDSGSGGNDTVELGAGILPGDVTVTQGSDGYDLVLAVAGTQDKITLQNTMIGSGDRIERVTFADGTVWTHADLVQRSMLNNGGDDRFRGTYDAETLTGGAGNDVLNGYVGNDVLIGGTGSDFLTGGGGDDTFRFNLGDGKDIVRDAWGDSGSGGNDTVELGAGILPGDVIVTQGNDGYDLVLAIAGTQDKITLQNTMISGGDRIERVIFADGTVWTHADLVQRSMLNNGGDDRFRGTYDAETLTGGAGNDVLNGYVGNDILIGGTGNDFLTGGGGDDTFRFNLGDGKDIVRDAWGDSGSGGNDTLEFGTSILPGDVTVTQSNDGYDLVLAIAGTQDKITLQNTMIGSGDRIEQVTFADGTVWTHAELVQRSMLNNGGDDRFRGTYDAETLTGGAGNDVLNGYVGDDILIGGTGNDFLTGGGGDDTFRFNLGDGKDIVRDAWGDSGSGGNDTLEFGAGILPGDVTVAQGNNSYDLVLAIAGTEDKITLQNTMISTGDRIERVTFADGTVWTHADLVDRSSSTNSIFEGGAGNDVISGTAGSDTFDGGLGNDTLMGGAGHDTYLYRSGDGNDHIYDYNAGAADRDTLKLVDLNPGDVELRRSGDHLYIKDLTTGQEIWVEYQFHSSTQDAVERIQFADGTIWDAARIQQEAWYRGTAVAETIDGTAGADTIVGGGGNDTLRGSQGNDVYIYASGDGSDVVYDYNAGVTDLDVLKFTDLNPEDLIFRRAGDHLYIKDKTTGQEIQGLYQFHASNQDMVESVQFANGTVWDAARIRQEAWYRGTAAAETIDGTAGADTIVGGGGNDTLRGSQGNDVYIYASGDGSDVVYDYNAGVTDLDVLKFTDLNPDDLIFRRSGDHLYIKDKTTGQEIQGLYQFHASNQDMVESIQFADGTVWDAARIRQEAWLRGTAIGERIDGASGADVIQGGGGDDYLIGWAGNDTYVYRSGDGSDRIYDYNDGVSDSDTLKLIDLNPEDVELRRSGDHLYVKDLTTGQEIWIEYHFHPNTRAAMESIEFADGTIWNQTRIAAVAATSGNDIILGSAGQDWLRGLDGNDSLTGYEGDDYLNGGSGSDSAVFRGDRAEYTLATINGTITITDDQGAINGNDGTDTLVGVETASFKDTSINLAAPIVLDLNGDGVALVDNKKTKVGFDWDGDGLKNETGWIGKDDGFLFIDRDGNGTVSNGSELSFTSDKEGAKSDLDGLRAFDSNGDGIFSSADDRFAQFGVWQDKNGNGRVDSQEILTLGAAGVASINLTGEAASRNWEWGENITVNTGSFDRTNGSVGSFSDVALSYDTGSPWSAAISKAASQLSEAMAHFGERSGTDTFGKFEELAERRDNFLASVRSGWR